MARVFLIIIITLINLPDVLSHDSISTCDERKLKFMFDNAKLIFFLSM